MSWKPSLREERERDKKLLAKNVNTFESRLGIGNRETWRLTRSRNRDLPAFPTTTTINRIAINSFRGGTEI